MKQKDKMFIGIDKELHSRLKVFCEENAIKMNKWVELSIKDWLMKEDLRLHPEKYQENLTKE